MELKEENFRKIADDLPFGLYIVEPDRTIVYWNKEAEQITGYKREEMVGKHCPQSGLFHMKRDEAFANSSARSLLPSNREKNQKQELLFFIRTDTAS